MKLSFFTFILFLFLLFLSAGSANAQASYSITDLGILSETGIATGVEGAMAINDRGQVAGGINDHAFLWTDGRMSDLGTLPPAGPEDGTSSVAYGLDNQSEIVGSSGSFGPIFMSGLQFARGIITRAGRLQQLTGQNASFIPYAINDGGQVAGLNAYRGFFYTNARMVELGTLSHVPNGNRSLARSLNQQGQVVGWSTVGTLHVGKFGRPACHAFLWQKHGEIGRMRDLGTLAGWVNSYAYGINKKSEVTGSVSDASGDTDGVKHAHHTAAFLWRRGRMARLGTLPGGRNSAAFGINDSTAVVGTSDDRAFLWTQGRMLDLNSCLPSSSGWTLEEAQAINDKGQIIGRGRFSGQTHMFLMTPLKH